MKTITKKLTPPDSAFAGERIERIASYPQSDLARAGMEFMAASTVPKYSYNFDWMSRPIIQYPQDIVAMQELIWSIQPDLVIETGIAHGGSLIFSASMLAMLDYCDATANSGHLDIMSSRRCVLGIDVDIRSHNRAAIESHPLSHKIRMLQGSSTSPEILERARSIAKQHETVLVCLDSNHTHDHVLQELNTYAPLVTKGSYCVVFDTIIENLPEGMYPDRPWGKGDNPMSAVREFLVNHPEFRIDEQMDNKLLISVAPQGYLQRIA